MSDRTLAVGGVFLPLSFATVGGGLSAVPGFRRQLVEVHHWMTADEFVRAFTVSRMAPGPNSLLVTLLGWRVDGLLGAIVATIAIFGPTSLLVFIIARFWHSNRGARWQVALDRGLRPVAAGLMMAAAYLLVVDLAGGWVTRTVTAASFLLLTLTRISPLLLLAGGAVICGSLYGAGLFAPL